MLTPDITFEKIKYVDLDDATNLLYDAMHKNYITHIEIEMKLANNMNSPSKNAKMSIKNQFKHLYNNKNVIFVSAKKSNKLIGFALGVIENKNNIKIGNFWDIVVDKNYRGKGIGSQLVERIHSFFIKRNVNHIILDVNPKNLLSINMYKKFGYVQTSLVMIKKVKNKHI